MRKRWGFRASRWPFPLLGAVGLAVMIGAWAAFTPPAKAPLAAPFSPTVAPSLTLTYTPTPTFTPAARPTDTPRPTPTLALPSPTAPPPSPTPTATSTPTPEPLPTPDGVTRTLRVPILMYHYISEPPPDADAIRRDLSIRPEVFEEHLRFLKEAGYTSISLADLALALEAGYPLPEKPIILTFDDGYRDNFEVAFPLLQQYGFKATFFLLTAPLDAQDPAYISWEQAVALDAAGMELGAHGYTHVDLRGRTVDYLVWQVLGSKEAIEARIRKPVRFFCYPSGQYDDLTIRVLHSAGYWGAVTTEAGDLHRSGELFTLRRVRVHGRYTAEALADVLEWFAAQGETVE